MKRTEYDFIFISQVPVFYKVNLYNSLSDRYKVLVIFLAKNTTEKRSNDFLSTGNIKFDYTVVENESLQKRNKIKTILSVHKIISRLTYRKLVLCAWDYIETWFFSWCYDRSKNSFVLESSIYESKVSGFRKFLKQIFLLRISTVYASGFPHVELLSELRYRGDVIKTRGVGLINKNHSGPIEKECCTKDRYFLFIGRLIKEKNIRLLLDYFSANAGLSLKIIGEGPLDEELRCEAPENVEFLGSVSNHEISKYLSHAIALVLPSKSEPWGLVVEEALFNSCHVIVSKTCGVVELLDEVIPNQIFDPDCLQDFDRAVKSLLNEYRLTERMELGPKMIDQKDVAQINSYNLRD